MKNMKHILVTGATGFLGSRTVERLSVMPGLSVRATGRKLKTNNQVNSDNVHYMLGDLNDSDFVSKLVVGVDCIVHAAALSSPWGSKDDFWKSNVNPTKLLLEAAVLVSRFYTNWLRGHPFCGQPGWALPSQESGPGAGSG